MEAIRNFSRFFWRCARVATEGDWRYYAWVGFLALVTLVGINAYARQMVGGLYTTGMSDEVCWGVYIANFTFLVGVAAAAVMMVIPVYLYRNEDLHELVVFGELLAVAAILMCLAFVTVDLGRPDRFWHLAPFLGKLNFPGSMLSWDVIVLNGYLALNVYICGYLLYSRYNNRKPSKWFYVPFVFIAIFWAVSIHTVTAFLYVGLGGRPFWNSAIVGPRFIASAFTAGPALIILTLQVIRKFAVGRPASENDALQAQLKKRSRPLRKTDLARLKKKRLEFANATESALETLLTECEVCALDPGVEIMREGDLPGGAFFVLEGALTVSRGRGTSRKVLHQCLEGDVVGEISPLTGANRTATVTVDEPSRILRISPATLKKLMRDPGFNLYLNERVKARLLITDKALYTLRSIVQVSMLINVFLLCNEVFTEFYTGTLHASSAHYLYYGLHGHDALVPWIWTAIALNLTAMTLLALPISRSLKYLNLACVLCIVGIWIEKGMGLVVPGFVPTPLGDIVEYSPTMSETLISLGIWAGGFLCYTLLVRMTVPILHGTVNRDNERAAESELAVPAAERVAG